MYAYPDDADVMTYATTRPFSFMLEPVVKVLHTDDYSQEELDRDLSWLGQHGVDVETSLRRWNKYKRNFRTPNPSFALLWYVITKAKRSDDDDELGPEWTAPGTYDPAYARDLMVGLGHEVVDDRHGMIYSSEPEQAVFFTNRSFRIVPAEAPSTAASRTFVPNPAWVTETLARSYEILEDTVPPAWLPRLDSVKPGDHAERVSARIKEYGCGKYGCVFPTLDSGVVMKVTTDDTEAEFAATLAATLVHPICVEYKMVVALNSKHDGRSISLLWRESADHVGGLADMVDDLRGGEAGDIALSYIIEQHQAAQLAYAAFRKSSPTVSRSLIRLWVESCERMARQTEVPELQSIGAGLVACYQQQHIFFGDVHEGNLGMVHRRDGTSPWVITDPGNVAVVNL